MSEEKIELSLEELTAVIELNPNDAEGYINRAKYYYEQGNHEITLIDFIKAIELAPNDSDNYIAITDNYFDQGDYDLALAVLTKLIELNPNSRDACKYYSDRGCSYAYLDHNELALADFNKAIQLNPSYALVYCNRGIFYRIEKKYDLAIADLSKSIKLDPNNANYYAARGGYYYDKKIYQLAIADHNKAIELEPEKAIFYINKSSCYKEQKNYEAAIADYTKAIELSPDNDNYYNLRAICNDQMKNYKTAIVDYTKAIELKPDNAVLYGNRASCYENQNTIDLAIDDYSKADDLVEHLKDYENYHQYGNPDAGEYFYYMHKWQELELRRPYQPEQEKRRALLNKITKEIESEPDSPSLYRKRAEVHKQLNNNDSALTDYTKAIELNSECSEVYHERGVLYFEQGNFELALDDFNNAINLNPDHSESYLRRGICYIEQEVCDLAFIDFNKTVELNPESYLAYHHLANHYYAHAEYNLGLDNIDKAIQFSDSLELKKDYCFFGKSIACYVKKYDKAREYIELVFSQDSEQDNSHKDIYLQDIDKEKMLAEKNQQLEEEIKQKEIAQQEAHNKEKEMLSFFTHTMRNALATAPESLRQAIRLLGSDDYEHNQKHYEVINEITGLFSTLTLTDCLIDTFKQSIYDTEEFQRNWQLDNSGEATPEWFIAIALRQSLNRIMFMSSPRDLKKLLENDKTRIKPTRKAFIEQVLPLDSNQHDIELFYQWLTVLPTIEVNIEKTALQFGANQIKFSLLFAISSELTLNALKYWSGEGKIQISWHLEAEQYIFRVKNACKANANSQLAGTHKGLAFIQRLIDLLDEQGEHAQLNCAADNEGVFTAELRLHQRLFEG